MLSLRRALPTVPHCFLFEFEDVIQDIDDVDLVEIESENLPNNIFLRKAWKKFFR